MTTIQKEFNIDVLDLNTRDCAGVLSRGQISKAKTHTLALRKFYYNPFEYHFCFFHQINNDFIVENLCMLNNMMENDVINAFKEQDANRIFLRNSQTQLELIYEKGTD